MSSSAAAAMTGYDTYWAAAPTDRIGDLIQAKVDDYYLFLQSSSLVDLWRRSYYAYYGMDANSSSYNAGIFAIGSITPAGDEGEIARIKVNQFANYLTHAHVLTTQDRPALSCKATNSDSKSLAQATVGDGIVDYYMREQRLERAFSDVVELGLLLGEGFIRLDWDASTGPSAGKNPDTGREVKQGNIVHKVYNPFDIIRDTTAKSWDSLDWKICHDTENRFNLAAKYPALAKDILSQSIDFGSGRRFIDPTKIMGASGNGAKDSDLVDVYELLHKPTAALPAGRFTIILQGGLVLFDGPLPFEKVPLYRLAPREVIGAPFGWTIAFDTLALQELVDKLYTIASSNALGFGMQNIWSPPENGVNKVMLGGGLNLIESFVKPEVLQLLDTPAEVYNFIGTLERVMGTLWGISDVNRGEIAAKDMSGTALALLASQAVTFSSGLQRSYTEILEGVGTGVIDILKDYATTPRLAVISGIADQQMLKEFVGQDLMPIDRVVAEQISASSKTIAGRTQLAQNLLNGPNPISNEQYINVMNTGQLEPATEGAGSAEILIRLENEMLRNGQMPIMLESDDHQNHVREHFTVLNSQAARQDAALVKAVNDHCAAHITMELKLQQENPALLAILREPPLPLPPPPPPPAGGPGPVPAPPGGRPAPSGPMLSPPGQAPAPEARPANLPRLPKGADPGTAASYEKLKAGMQAP